MRNLIITFFIGLIASPLLGIEVATSTAKSKTLTLEAFIEKAIQKDTEFEEILIDRMELAYQKTLQLPARDIVLNAKSEAHFFLDPSRSKPELSLGLSKLFSRSATELAAGYSRTPTALGAATQSEVNFSLSQEIAQNAFGRSTRWLDAIVGLEVDVAQYQIIEAYEDYLAQLTAAYYDWYETYESLQIALSAYQSNLQLLENMKARQKSRIALPIDVNKVRLQTIAKKESVINLTASYERYLNIVERSMRENLSDTVPVAPSVPNLSDDFLEKRYQEFLTSSRTEKILKKLEERSRLNVNRKAEEVLPSIKAYLNYLAQSDAHTSQKVLAGLSLDWPLEQTQARAGKSVALLEAKKTALSNENVRYRIYTELKNLFLQMQREQRLISSARDKLELARGVLEAESENYSFGRASLNDYIIAVNAVDTHRFSKISHEVLLRQLMLEFRRLTDVLVQKDSN